MRIIIAGAGQVGVGLAKYLRAENHDIVLIDNNVERLGSLSEQLDIQTIEGSSAYPAVLEKAGADQADIFLAVTGSDETNIVACGVAHSVFHVPRRIARIGTNEYLQKKYKAFLEDQKIDIILSPEIETARHILENLSVAGAIDFFNLADGKVHVVGLKCKKTSTLLGKSISQIEKMLEDVNCKIIAIKRRKKLVNLQNVVIKQGDDVYFILNSSDLQQVLDIFAYENTTPECVVIFGGGKVGYQLAKQMEINDFCKNLTVIEKNEDRALFLAEKLRSSIVLNMDGLDDAFVDEVDLKNYQIAIATTQSDESNILLSLLSKRNGIEKTCALIHSQLYSDLTTGMGIDVSIDPNAVLVSAILQHIRKGRVKGDHFISSGVGEILEIEALDTSKITHKPLGKIKIPEGIVVCGVVRDEKFSLPSKDLLIKPKDTVILFVERGKVRAAETLFTVGFSFF